MKRLVAETTLAAASITGLAMPAEAQVHAEMAYEHPEALPTYAETCTYTVIPNTGEWRIERDTGLQLEDIAKEMGVSNPTKLIIANKVLDTCLGNGVNDVTVATSNPNSATTTTLPAATSETTPTSASTCPTEVTSLSSIAQFCLDESKQKLRALGFVDDDITRAIKAFQIETGITSQGKKGYGNLGPSTYSSLMSGRGAAVIQTATDKILNGIVIDKSDQTLMAYVDGTLKLASLISTGLSTPTSNRETRLGKFSISRTRTDEDGWVRSSLQDATSEPAMYIPYYFSGGQAIHGSKVESKLGQKASHGCTRTPKNIQDKLISQRLLFVSQVVVVQE